MRVFIAEDDLTSREILKAALQKWECKVVAACDGDQA
jgi:DNA-binding response OmpR family regulator